MSDTSTSGSAGDTEALFHAAADHLAQLVTSNPASVPDSSKLQLYGLYKQATIGPCHISKPVFWNRAGCAKWNAWHKLRDLSQQAAMSQYIDVLQQQDPQWSVQAAAAAATAVSTGTAGSRQQGSSSKGGIGGPVFSTLASSSEQQEASTSGSMQELASQGDIARLKAALASGVAVDSTDHQGCTALHFAADRGRLDVLQLLQSAGADVNAQDEDKQTPLHYAAICGQLEACQLLLQQGADASLRDREGNTAQQVGPQHWSLWSS